MKNLNTLFKYGKFDKHVKENLLEGVAYFCPANKLDDLYECKISVSSSVINKNFKVEILKAYDLLLKILKPVYKGDFKSNKVLNEFELYLKKEKYKNIDLSKKYKKLVNKEDENVIDCLNRQLGIKDNNFEKAFQLLFNMQVLTGVFSLSTKWNNQELWAHYAKENSGYCIEYDIEKAFKDKIIKRSDLYKVEYKSRKNNDIMLVALELFIYVLMYGDLAKNLKATSEITKRIVAVKHPDWKQQCEWRLVGSANAKIILPIKAIYLGARIAETNKRKVLKRFKNSNIDIYQLKIGLGNSYKLEKI